MGATPEEITGLQEANGDVRQAARARAEACMQEISAALERHRCRILPRIDPSNIEPVGMAGDRIIVTATYWVAPLAP